MQHEDDSLSRLEERIGVRFQDRGILVRALTHHSMCPKTSQRDCYDTLEFLGDALIGVQVVEHLFHALPRGERRRTDGAQVGSREPEGAGAHRRRAAAWTTTFGWMLPACAPSMSAHASRLRADVVEALVAATLPGSGPSRRRGVCEQARCSP